MGKFWTFSLVLGLTFPIFSHRSFGSVVVDGATGTAVVNVLDFKDPSSGFQIDRSYTSQTHSTGVFGRGWCSNIETKLQFSDRNNITLIHCGSGRHIRFKRNSGHTFRSESPEPQILRKLENSWELELDPGGHFKTGQSWPLSKPANGRRVRF